ncbi:hypothetical protein PUN28_006951 [Cardiocondyla obscurior]|uniref:Ribosomal protein S14 n=1 Tax=Cardiocondyla obscurior TaxID=286306 RepID=A0AAW2G0K6_9HYME
MRWIMNVFKWLEQSLSVRDSRYVAFAGVRRGVEEEKQIRARVVEAGGRAPCNRGREREKRRAREKRTREGGGRRVRPGYVCQTIREIALTSVLGPFDSKPRAERFS